MADTDETDGYLNLNISEEVLARLNKRLLKLTMPLK